MLTLFHSPFLFRKHLFNFQQQTMWFNHSCDDVCWSHQKRTLFGNKLIPYFLGHLHMHRLQLQIDKEVVTIYNFWYTVLYYGFIRGRRRITHLFVKFLVHVKSGIALFTHNIEVVLYRTRLVQVYSSWFFISTSWTVTIYSNSTTKRLAHEAFLDDPKADTPWRGRVG